MNKLFENINHNNIYNSSNEVIEPQIDDPAVIAITEEFSKLIKIVNTGVYKPEALYKAPIPSAHFANIDRIIKERFGINAKHVFTPDLNYGVMPTVPKRHNVLKDDVVENYDKLIAVTKHHSRTKKVKDINSERSDNNEILLAYTESIKALDKKMSEDGVIVDLENGRIENLPDDYVAFFVSNVSGLVNIIKITDRELTAILLHEIGHAFSQIENSYKLVHNTVVVLDTVIDNVEKKNKSLKNSLSLAYGKIGGDSKDLVTDNVSNIFLKVAGELVNNTGNGDGGGNVTRNTHHKTDSEQLADQFSTRFGVGSDLITMMRKLTNLKYNTGSTSTERARAIQVSGSSVIILVLVAIFAYYNFGFIFIIGLYTVIFLSMISIIKYIFNNLTSVAKITSGDTISSTYDNDPRRMTRIKNDIVRQIRNADLPMTAKQQCVRDTVVIDKIIAETPNNKKSLLVDKLYRTMFKNPKVLLDNKELDQLVEDISENTLHVSYNKLRTL